MNGKTYISKYLLRRIIDLIPTPEDHAQRMLNLWKDVLKKKTPLTPKQKQAHHTRKYLIPPKK